MACALLIAVLFTTGCAATVQQRPTVGRTCASSKLWIVDAVLAAGIIAAASYGAHEGNEAGLTTAGIGLVAAGVEVGSMVTGLKWNVQCRSGEVPASALAAR